MLISFRLTFEQQGNTRMCWSVTRGWVTSYSLFELFGCLLYFKESPIRLWLFLILLDCVCAVKRVDHRLKVWCLNTVGVSFPLTLRFWSTCSASQNNCQTGTVQFVCFFLFVVVACFQFDLISQRLFELGLFTFKSSCISTHRIKYTTFCLFQELI